MLSRRFVSYVQIQRSDGSFHALSGLDQAAQLLLAQGEVEDVSRSIAVEFRWPAHANLADAIM